MIKYINDYILCICLIPPANCSLTVVDCWNSQVQYKIERIHNSCSGPGVTVTVTQTHTSTVGMDNDSSGSLVLSQTVQFIVISVVVCVFCSLCFSAVGFLCHCHRSKQKPQPVTGFQSPQYEDILHKHSRSEQIELKENEAYGPLRIQY